MITPEQIVELAKLITPLKLVFPAAEPTFWMPCHTQIDGTNVAVSFWENDAVIRWRTASVTLHYADPDFVHKAQLAIVHFLGCDLCLKNCQWNQIYEHLQKVQHLGPHHD